MIPLTEGDSIEVISTTVISKLDHASDSFFWQVIYYSSIENGEASDFRETINTPVFLAQNTRFFLSYNLAIFDEFVIVGQ